MFMNKIEKCYNDVHDDDYQIGMPLKIDNLKIEIIFYKPRILKVGKL